MHLTSNRVDREDQHLNPDYTWLTERTGEIVQRISIDRQHSLSLRLRQPERIHYLAALSIE
jgi:hypothetical protein